MRDPIESLILRAEEIIKLHKEQIQKWENQLSALKKLGGRKIAKKHGGQRSIKRKRSTAPVFEQSEEILSSSAVKPATGRNNSRMDCNIACNP